MQNFDPYKHKQISVGTRNLYMHNLQRLAGTYDIQSLQFLADPEIHAKLATLKPNTRRTYLIAIVSALKGQSGDAAKALYDEYYKEMMEMNLDLVTANKKTDKQRESWMTQDEIEGIQRELSKIVPILEQQHGHPPAGDLHTLSDLVVLSLYTLQPPRRSLDYVDCQIVSTVPADGTNNYLDTTNWNWVFNNYKTARTYGRKIVPVDRDLQKILLLYLRFYNGFYRPPTGQAHMLLPNIRNSTAMTRALYRITGAKISVNMLRTIFLTGKYGTISELGQDTEAMGTSVKTAMHRYIKHA